MMDGRLACWEKKELEWKKSWIFNLWLWRLSNLRAKDL
jgi:hypothetical protein